MKCRTCEKPKVHYKKGLWSPEEDQKLKDYILKYGHGCWSTVPSKAGLQRNGKSCRLRWINYLRPGLKRGIFSVDEEETVIKLHASLGNKWSQIAMHLPGRTDNEVKNYWNSYLKKRVAKAEASNPSSSTIQSQDSGYQSSKTSQLCQELNNTQHLVFRSSEPMESSPMDSGQSMQHCSDFSSLKGTPQNPLPKLLFADWLPANHVNDQGSTNFNGLMSCTWDFNSGVEQGSKAAALQVGGQSTGGFVHGFGETSIYGELQSQFEPLVQAPGSGLFDVLSMGDMCGGFDSDHDLIYRI